MKKFFYFLILASSVTFSKDYIQLIPEAGINTAINYDFNDFGFNYGGYLKFLIAKNSFVGGVQTRFENPNLKAGILLGGEIKDFVVLYGGLNYSHLFNKTGGNGFGAEIGASFYPAPYFSLGIYIDYTINKVNLSNAHIFGGGITIGIPF